MSADQRKFFGLAILTTLSLQAAACGRRPATVAAATDERGSELFEAHCALCHGAEGGADGVASFLLFPPARDFRQGRFKLASSVNGAPTEEDLLGVLRRGLPGSSMPSWSWMPGDDLRALARHVRELAVEGITEELSWGLDALDEAEARSVAIDRTTPAQLLRVPPALAPGEAVLAEGRDLFAGRCVACHGADGKGRPEIVRPDIDETRNWARDITTGILKGGARHADLARSIQAGMHGTAMPATELDDSQMSALLAYVKSLIPSGSEDRLVQRHATIVARRASGPVPMDPTDPAWQESDPVPIVLAPLWWRDGAILEAEVRALFDPATLALRVRWADPTHEILMSEEPPYEAPRYADGVAVQFSSLEHPPFFGMREGGEPTQLWHWRATYPFSPEQLVFVDTVLTLLHHAMGDWQFAGAQRAVPVYQLAQGPVEIVGEPTPTLPQGLQVLDLQARTSAALLAQARWSEGAWEVVLAGPRAVFAEGERELLPGGEVSLNFAIWNGAIGDLRGQKSVTIWHRLLLADGGS